MFYEKEIKAEKATIKMVVGGEEGKIGIARIQQL
jgi:hypothetical protein